MVSTLSIIAMCVTFFFAAICPVIFLIFLLLRNKGQKLFGAWIWGAAGFLFLSLIAKTYFLNILNETFLPNRFAEQHLVLYCLVIASITALFEQTARVLYGRLLLEEVNSSRAFMVGLGHGSCEAITVVGLSYINNILYSLSINNGSFEDSLAAVTASGMDPGPLLNVKEILITTPSYHFLCSGYERLLMLLFQIALTMIVCYGVTERKTFLYTLYAFLLQLMVQFVTLLISGLVSPVGNQIIPESMGYVITYSFLTLVAAASFLLIRRLLKKEWHSFNSIDARLKKIQK